MKRAPGFTLIELLVALAIFALVASMAYRALDGTIRARDALEAESAQWRDLSLAFARIEEDLATLLDRRSVNANGLADDALRLSSTVPGADEASFALTRLGFAGAGGEGAAPQRIGYRFREGALELMIWPGVDQAPRTAPGVHRLIGSLSAASWRAMDAAGQWQNVWRSTDVADANKPGVFPAALELNLTLLNGQRVRRVFVVRRG
ncbi:MAG: type II secretion system minor pseudopilin GspJ [Betaproteobacteria bacterium]|nr:type II secretion system minor pseudopilin GspJ [Betaproteobacteria bacterium]